MRRFVAAAAFAAVIAVLSLAQQDKITPQKLDGLNLLRACDGPEGAVDRLYCVGVVHGVSFWLLPKGCSDDVSMGQMVLVVNKYLKDHPEDLNLPDALLVSAALSKAFPCPTSHIK
jgi:Rap1a immunity proteins